ncbi:MAG: CDP-alcohol phosphatidyltransferase family protein [Rhodospirillales bacterium]|nr:MAG: CDP-alcohol phosphatidyltransferase family protein [Rhodospirillales bacterium]
MLDPLMRRLVDPPLKAAGRRLAAWGVGADALTVAGLAVGLLAVPLIIHGWFLCALAVVALNRVIDGLDGAVARHRGPTDFGGYLDIVADMLFYAGVVLGFALRDPAANGVWAAVLLASFVGTCASFLGWAVIAAKRGDTTEARGRKSFFHSAGVIEGTETIAFLVALCLFPRWFAEMAAVFAALCLWTVVMRVLAARAAFGGR